ncbi:MAG: LPS export ABC transporter permease LptG [Candidatus Thiodiazotropha sp.]
MISLLDRYIGRAVLLSIIAVLVLLLVLIGFFQVLTELEEVGKDYTTALAYIYVLMTMPRFTYELFPVATLLGSLIGLGTLAGNGELNAMRAAGVSIGRILLSTLKVGILMLLLVVVIGEYVAPRAELQAQKMKMDALSAHVTLKTRYGFWSRDGNSYINIREILPNRVLADVSVYDYDGGQRLKRALHARRAVYGDEGWVLESVRESDFTPGRILVSHRKSMPWSTRLQPSLLDVVTVTPQLLPAWDLWRYIGFLKQNGQSAQSYEVAFWGKLIAPLVTLVMLFLSVPFVFGSLRSVGIGQRVFVGAIFGIVFFLLNRAFSYLAVVYDLNALFSSLIPVLIFFVYALWMFRRVGR